MSDTSTVPLGSCVDVGADPDGAGSVLPNLIIKVVDPADVQLSDVAPSKDGGLKRPKLVQ